MALCNRTWGPTLGPTLFGWMFAMHQLGAAAGALMPGRMRDASGSYEGAWQLGAILSFVGSAIAAFTPYSAEAKSAEMWSCPSLSPLLQLERGQESRRSSKTRTNCMARAEAACCNHGQGCVCTSILRGDRTH
eukprot:6892442-Prymnesium_polylepis.1